MSQFSINPNILPPNKSIHPNEHRRHVVVGIVAAVLAICLGIVYYIWGTNSSRHLQTTADVVAQIKAEHQVNDRAQVLAQLRSATTTPLTAAQRKKLISSMTKATTTVTAAQKQHVINQLNNK